MGADWKSPERLTNPCLNSHTMLLIQLQNGAIKAISAEVTAGFYCTYPHAEPKGYSLGIWRAHIIGPRLKEQHRKTSQSGVT